MDRLKTFAKYLIAFLIVFFVVGFLGDRLMFSRFKHVEDGHIEESFIELNDIECKATKQNGYIDGVVTNKTGKYVNSLNMKIELYDNEDKLLKTDNIEVQDLKISGEKTFKFFYYVENVDRYKIVDIVYD